MNGDDNSTFAKRMAYKRTGQCPICDSMPPAQSGKFETRMLPAGTEYHQMAVLRDDSFMSFDPSAPIRDTVHDTVAIKMESFHARDKETGIGMSVRFGAAIGPKSKPIVFVTQPTLIFLPDSIVEEARRAHERAERVAASNEALRVKLGTMVEIVELLRSATPAKRKRGKRLAKKMLNGGKL